MRPARRGTFSPIFPPPTPISPRSLLILPWPRSISQIVPIVPNGTRRSGSDRLARSKTAIQYEGRLKISNVLTICLLTATISMCVAKMTQFVMNLMHCQLYNEGQGSYRHDVLGYEPCPLIIQFLVIKCHFTEIYFTHTISFSLCKVLIFQT